MDRVINEMAKAKGDVEKRYREKIPEIIRECMAFAYLGKSFTFNANADLENRVNQRLIELSDEILADIEERAKKAIQYAEEEEDEGMILAYMKRERDGEDLITRIDKHNSNFRYFLEGWMAIGMVNGLSEGGLLSNILTYIGNPFVSPLWQKAFNEGYLSNAIRTRGYSFGKGILKNPIEAQTEISRNAINEAFQYGRFIRYGKDGAIGYTIHRGSSFDCPYCDSFTGIVHPMDVCLLPLHPRCCCWSKPVYIYGSDVPVSVLPLAEEKPTAKKAWNVRSYGRGVVNIHSEVDTTDSDFKHIMAIAEHFAKEGRIVTIPPKLTHTSKFDYDEIYGSLKNTPFCGKCPDLNVDGIWYEHEGFVTNNHNRALANMISRGLEQCDRLIINKTNHTARAIRHRIWLRQKEGQNIKELWTIDENFILELIYKNSDIE